MTFHFYGRQRSSTPQICTTVAFYHSLCSSLRTGYRSSSETFTRWGLLERSRTVASRASFSSVTKTDLIGSCPRSATYCSAWRISCDGVTPPQASYLKTPACRHIPPQKQTPWCRTLLNLGDMLRTALRLLGPRHTLRRSLMTATGFDRPNQLRRNTRQTARRSVIAGCAMATVRGAHSCAPGSLIPGLSTRVQPPPPD